MLIQDVQMTSSVGHHVEAAMIVSMTVVEADTAVVATMTIIVDHATTTVSAVPMVDAMTTMALVASIATLQDVMIVIAAVEMTVAAAMSTMAETPDVRVPLRMANRHRQEIAEILTVEVELSTTVMTIGTPVDRLRSANLLRC